MRRILSYLFEGIAKGERIRIVIDQVTIKGSRYVSLSCFVIGDILDKVVVSTLLFILYPLN